MRKISDNFFTPNYKALGLLAKATGFNFLIFNGGSVTSNLQETLAFPWGYYSPVDKQVMHWSCLTGMIYGMYGDIIVHMW